MAEPEAKGSVTQRTAALWAILALLLGTLLGSGAIWQYMQVELQRDKQALEEVMAANKLRKETADIYEKLIQLNDEIMGIATIGRKQHDSKLRNKANHLRRQRDLLEDNLTFLESKLAKIENREPRKISTDFIPPAAPR